VGGAAAATVGLLSWTVTSWAHHIDQAAGDRITPYLFAARGVVPIGYALFAFMLGVTLGTLIRRTVPAMAATLAIYCAAVISMQEWARAHLVPASHAIRPLDTSSLDTLMLSDNNQMTVIALGLRQDLTYHPASHFWPLQWTEAGIFIALAVMLAGFCFWWTRRRLT
jgi:hypothetical protein